MNQDSLGPAAVERVVREFQPVRVAHAVLHGQVKSYRPVPSLADHALAAIHTDDLALVPHVLRQGTDILPGSAANVQYLISFMDVKERQGLGLIRPGAFECAECVQVTDERFSFCRLVNAGKLIAEYFYHH
jgi:hypothetical protein